MNICGHAIRTSGAVWRRPLAHGNQNFLAYLVAFVILFVLRMMTTIVLAIANTATLVLYVPGLITGSTTGARSYRICGGCMREPCRSLCISWPSIRA